MQPFPILAYHSIAETNNNLYSPWCVTPKTFHQHMAILKQNNYHAITTGDLVARLASGRPAPRKCVVITFDDGMRDFKDNAVPILAQFGFPATLYVVAGLIGRTSRWLAPLNEGDRSILSAAELRDLDTAGIEIGGHSMTHPEMDILAQDDALYELVNCREILEDTIGKRVRSFAYPHGYATDKTRKQARQAGYQSAVRVRHAMSNAEEDVFGLSRLIIEEDMDQSRFSELLRGRGVATAPPQSTLKSDLWRAARRLRNWHRNAGAASLAPQS